MPTFAPITSSTALFLDFDGTLVDFADTPDAVKVPATLISLLRGLQALLEGALAIVSGRQIDVLDQFLAPLRLPLAGEHGLQRRTAAGRMLQQHGPDSSLVLQACRSLAAQHPALLVEQKMAAVALHYRRAPELEALCRDTLGRALQGQTQFELLEGKLVVEAVPAHANKGHAIDAFLSEPPFCGRAPVFAGDDRTDESGFCTVQARGGHAIKVGPGATLARHRLGGVQAVHEWLAATQDLLACQAGSKAAR